MFTGIAVHDGYNPYRRYGAAHQLCNAHHLRELAGICDVDPSQTWAEQMIRLLCEINDMTYYARTVNAYAIEERLLGVYRDRYQTIIAAGKAANRAPAGHGARTGHPHGQTPAEDRLRLELGKDGMARGAGDAPDPAGQGGTGRAVHAEDLVHWLRLDFTLPR